MLNLKFLPILVGLAALAALVALSSPVRAAQIFVEQTGTSAAGGEPNLITNTGAFVVGSAGSHTYLNPLLIIVGVYDGLGSPSISAASCGGIDHACSLATDGTYGLNQNTGITLLSNQDAYTQLDLTPSQSSEQFDNWACGPSGCPGSGGDIGLGLAKPTSFSLYVFDVPTSLLAGSPLMLDESGAAKGSYIIAYSCESLASNGHCNNGKDGSTPYTNAGLVAPAPPIGRGLPGILAAAGVLFGAGLLERSRKRRSRSAATAEAAA